MKTSQTSFGTSIKNLLITMAIGLAESAVQRHETTFTIAGKRFDIVQLIPGESYVTHSGQDAGIRIINGIAHVA